MLKFRFLVLTLTCLSIFASVVSAADDSRWLIPRSSVAKTELKIVWQFNLAISDSETLDELFVADNRLCALSSRNYLSCLNRADGNVMFSGAVAPAGLPVVGLGPYKDELMAIVGDNIMEINADFDIKKTPTKVSGVTCPVVRNDSFFYAAGLDKRLHALRVKDKVQVFEAAAENGSLVTSVVAGEQKVVFATETGNIVCITASGARKLWQFDTPAAVTGLVISDGDSLYFACRDTCVYCLELSSGRLLWKHQTQAILDTSPQLGKKVVYQNIPDVGLIALDKENGKLLWQLSDGLGLLAEPGGKAFVITKTGVLTAMDNAKAKQLYTIDLGGPVKYTTNLADAKIYVGDSRGRLACLQPTQ